MILAPSPWAALSELTADARLERKITQTAPAQQVGLGASTIRPIERGKAQGPRLHPLLALTDVLGLAL